VNAGSEPRALRDRSSRAAPAHKAGSPPTWANRPSRRHCPQRAIHPFSRAAPCAESSPSSAASAGRRSKVSCRCSRVEGLAKARPSVPRPLHARRPAFACPRPRLRFRLRTQVCRRHAPKRLQIPALLQARPLRFLQTRLFQLRAPFVINTYTSSSCTPFTDRGNVQGRWVLRDAGRKACRGR
jgi:hypothetical protein